MGKKRQVHSDEFKAKVALEAVKAARTLSELSSIFGVHPTVISQWKRLMLTGSPRVFRPGAEGRERSEEVLTAPLYEKIGRLEVELEYLKKKLCAYPGR